MDNNIEKELKILVSKEQFYALKEEYDPLHFETQINVYFDSEDKIIEKKHGAMRIRTKNNTHIFTLKMHSEEGLREHECYVDNRDVASLNRKEIIDLLNSYEISGPFVSTATLKTERAVYENEFAELCFDINYYDDCIDYEIEYEYRKEHDGIKAFNTILNKVNLVYTSNCKSKIQRALKR
mgnify:CR=1 FL=1